MSIVIARHEHNITLNDYEFVVDADGVMIIFPDKDEALHYLSANSDSNLTEEEWSEEGIYLQEYIEQP